MIEWSAGTALVLLVAAGLLSLLRLWRSETLANRVIALDSLLVAVVNGLAVHAAFTQQLAFLDVMVVTALLGFTGTALVAQFIERRGP